MICPPLHFVHIRVIYCKIAYSKLTFNVSSSMVPTLTLHAYLYGTLTYVDVHYTITLNKPYGDNKTFTRTSSSNENVDHDQ